MKTVIFSTYKSVKVTYLMLKKCIRCDNIIWSIYKNTLKIRRVLKNHRKSF